MAADSAIRLTRDPRACRPRCRGSVTSRRDAARSDYGVVIADDGAVDSRCDGGAARGAGRMKVASTIVGVDVGGTFTDLLLFDAADQAFRTAKVPSQRGDEVGGASCRALQLLAASLNIGSIVHGTTVGTNTLLERRGPQDRRDHDPRLSRRAGDAPARPAANLGLVGRFHADRRPRHAGRSRRADAGRWQHPASGRRSGGSRGGAGAAASDGAEALAIIFINAYANPDNERTRSAAARASGPTSSSPPRTRCCRKFASSSAPRRRRSTPICSRWSPAYLGKLGAGAAGAEAFRRTASTSCSRMAGSCRRRPRGVFRCAPHCRVLPPA